MIRSAGVTTRLLTALTGNVAETAPDSPFPELRARPFPVPADHLVKEVRLAMRRLGWQVGAEDPESLQVQAVATSRIFRFRDDVTVRVEALESGGSRIFVRSASRVGKGDLGTNRRRIARLLEVLRSRVVRAG